ncbi:Negative modulator of initiation of replication [Alteromonas sp. ASW11-36]|uniref:Negative modulator of initiation of replication n=1 Tax=Alteromonas arenosi TaxID=3055817 RepID=A0ABT7SYA6_9ALTE|nr:Negative modulator of initiation of replication [Alteromonas sp. ASW11-36]MDM7861176.1 Negative modulator of initiation of replication [Alteromonas sp. ASW11-36]
MKTITIDDELYAYIAAQTKFIGEDASDILRRLLLPETEQAEVTPEEPESAATNDVEVPAQPEVESALVAPQAGQAEAGQYAPSRDKLLACATVVERFLLVLSDLAEHHSQQFEQVLAIKGKGRDYFATSKEHLLATGSSTNPKAIPQTDYWVVTNNNTSKKASILRQVAATLGYADNEQTAIAQSLTLK